MSSHVPALVPLLAMNPAMSTLLPSMDRFCMQPTNCRLCTGKASGRLGTPPSSRGPVRSRDLGRESRPSSVTSGSERWPQPRLCSEISHCHLCLQKSSMVDRAGRSPGGDQGENGRRTLLLGPPWLFTDSLGLFPLNVTLENWPSQAHHDQPPSPCAWAGPLLQWKVDQ